MAEHNPTAPSTTVAPSVTSEGLRRNSDPALDPAHQHHHGHTHHAASAQAPDDVVYSAGTTTDPTLTPDQSHLHKHHEHDIEKTAISDPPNYSDHEKTGAGIHQTGRDSSESPEVPTSWLGNFYRKYGIFVNALVFTTCAAMWIAGQPVHKIVPYVAIFIIVVSWWLSAQPKDHRTQVSILVHAFTFLFFTAWWITSLVLHRNDKNWVVPFLVWLAISLRLLFFYVPIRYISNPIKWTWKHTALVIYDFIPAKWRTALGGAGAIAVVLVGSFVSEETADNTRENRGVSLFGLVVLIFAFWLTSKHRSKVNWRTVIVGMLAQYIIGLFVLRTGVGYDIFKFIADRAGDLLGFAGDGVAFLTDADTAALPWFFIGVIPAIIFFIALVQVLYYIGFVQWFIKKLATFVFWGMGVSGAEAVVAAATPFIGQGESAMLVRPFVHHMTKAEIHQILTCGFATISGSVLVGYIGLGLNAQALVSSCIMSIPASLAISKLRYPETEETLTAGRVVIPDDEEHQAENALHSFANGAWLGIKIAGSIICSLLCIIALVGLFNGLLTWFGRYIDIVDPVLTLQNIMGYVLYPVSFLLGVSRKDNDILLVARLIAEKIITNEYNAFYKLAHDGDYANLSPRSQLIATYALCGFGNIGSLGIQIGILNQLAPSRGGDVSALIVSALISGVFSTLSSATVAGLVVTTQLSDFTTS